MSDWAQTDQESRRRETWLRAILDSASETYALGRALEPSPDGMCGLLKVLSTPTSGLGPQDQAKAFRNAGTKLLTLLNDILDLLDLESGRLELEQIDFDVRSVIAQSLELVRSQAQGKNPNLRFVSSDLPGWFIGDPARLQHLLSRLLGHAVDSVQGGAITLSLTADSSHPNCLHFSLTGSEMGVSEDPLGLGVDLCRRLLERMGGHFRQENSSIQFDLQFAPSEKQPHPPSNKAFTPPESASPTPRIIKVLIAEDSEDSRFLLQEFLKKSPYEITFAENGKVALEAARSQSFDLILMDIQMPVMDGLTAARLIREAEQEAGRTPTPLVALTANARKADIELSRAAGCNAHVLKPISRQELLNTIQKYAPEKAAREVPELVEVNIPAGLENAAQRYIQTRQNELPRLAQLVGAKEFEQLRILAHNMKGTGTSYGFPDLTRLGGLMESSAKDQNEADLSNQMLELSRYLEQASQMVAANLT